MELVEIGKFISAFVLVIGLIGLMALAMRKYGNPALRIRGREEARLSLVESLAIDPRSRLLLVRRDDREHLLIKSGDHYVVVESGIVAPAMPEPSISEPILPMTPKAAKKGK
jgi:flagellar protein FliO/FliZ